MAKNVLVIEDEKDIANLVKYNLEKAGFRCSAAVSGEDGLKFLRKGGVDLVILDIMLPGKSGLEVCREIKQDKNLARIPVVMLTARGEEVDRIVGFEMGADDYMVKPFSPRELVLRAQAILKRGEIPKDEESISAGHIKIDFARHVVMVNRKEIEITPMEFKLLTLLIQRKNRVQSRERLLNDVWEISSDVTTRTVDTHIKRLREKLGPAGDQIKTIRGVGYKFTEE